MKGLPARRVVYEKPLTGELIHRAMSRIFPRKNDYGEGSFEELVADLEALGIRCVGDFKRLMTHYRSALLRVDRSPLSRFERLMAIKDLGREFVSDTVRRQYWFAYPALVRKAIEMHFGEDAVPSQFEQ